MAGYLLVLLAAVSAALSGLLVLAVGVAVPIAGTAGPAAEGDRRGRIGEATTWLLALSALSLWAAIAFLATAILKLDTSYAYVAEQTRADMPLALRFSALWSGAEGSLLLFAAMVVTVLPIGHRSAPRWQRFGTAIIAAGFSVAVLIGANPFQRLALPPLSGAGMAPILEHFAMVIHPPMLYAGLCLAMAPALVRDNRRAHRLAFVSLALLTVSLGFGSAWAYVELGWGGWWAWDPIENVALIVWFLLAAGLHWQPLDREQGAGTGLLSAVTLWALCWPAVIGGAAMTRTSMRTSVHAFADAAGLSVWLWPLAALVAIGAAARVWEDRPRRPGPLPTRIPQAVLAMAAFIVAAGTYRPFVGGDGTAGWFYSRTLFPLAILGPVIVGVLPLLATRRAAIKPLVVRIGLPAAVALAGVCALAGWRQWFQLTLAASLGFGGALVVAQGRAGVARLCGHLGVLFILFGALAGTASVESAVWLKPGQTVDVDGHAVVLLGTEVTSESPLRAEARVDVDGHVLTPSVAVFADRNLRLPEVSTRTRPWMDTQAILRDVDPDAGALITLLFRPWNQLVWWGVGLIAVAAVLLAGTRTCPDSRSPGRVSLVYRAGRG